MAPRRVAAALNVVASTAESDVEDEEQEEIGEVAEGEARLELDLIALHTSNQASAKEEAARSW
jgi:hypothetical protein